MRAFTLVEVIVVVAIVGVLAALALGVGSDTVRQARAREEKEAVRSLLVQARNHARRNAACVRVTRTSAQQIDAALFVGTGCAAAVHAVPPAPSQLVLSLLTVAAFDDNGTTSTSLTFFPDGSTRRPGPVVLRLNRFDSVVSSLQVWPGAGIVSEGG